MELFRIRKFKKTFLILLFFIVTLLFLKFELLNAAEKKESGNNATEVKSAEQDSEKSGKPVNSDIEEDFSEKPEGLDDGTSSEAMGLFQSSDFDSSNKEGNSDNRENPDKSSERHSTIKLMEEAPPALDLEGIPRLNNDIDTKEKRQEQKSDSENQNSNLFSKPISTPTAQEQGSSFSSNSGSNPSSSSASESATANANSSVSSAVASASESAPDSFSSSVQTSALNPAFTSSQGDEEIKLENGEDHFKGSSRDSQEAYSSFTQKSLRGYKERAQPELSSVGVDSDSGSRNPTSSASTSGSGLLLPATSEASSDEAELQILLRSSTSNLPILDSASEDQKSTTNTGTQTNTDSESSYSSQIDHEVDLKDQNSSLKTHSFDQKEKEAEENQGKPSKAEMQVEESEFSSDFENNVEFPEDNSKASSSHAEPGSTLSSGDSNIKGEEITVTFEKPEIQESSTEVENLKKSQQSKTDNYVSVATQTIPIQPSTRPGFGRRRGRRIMTKRGVSQLIRELNNSKMKKKTTFFKKLISQISNDDINLISTLIGKEVAKREKNNVLRKTLTSSIPEKPLLGKEWIQREKSKKQTTH
ncbi:dentin sialophospho precursor [Cryptosporidium sp. chipmunk genotype I]|uniref:dentin sialophospho precursor n=1 Tax=Cryptosporidium sp. chipmunk genotype I TaxID=1280935 RepID=UPI00351A5F59|nr:dentin sialophospho precursor [Cryptosporidium sp. chipmunk genotype I]